MNKEDYLAHVKCILEEATAETSVGALDFNIFQILNAYDKEVMMCRVLYEFLNPKESHGGGCRYLKSFLEDILGFDDITTDELAKTKVYREYVIKDTDRRIDIYIDTPNRGVPVEVKIYAKEQSSQCLDYYLYADKENSKKKEKRKWKLAYLTLNGDMPSVYSTGNNTNCVNSIKTISWSIDVLRWLAMIKSSQETNVNVREVVAQYIDIIERLTNQKKGLVYKKMEETGLLDGKENMKAAQAISENFALRKTLFMETLFEDISSQLESEMNGINPWNNKELIHKYYQYQKSTLPALNYWMRDLSVMNEGEVFQLWLRFEIDSRPFVSFIIVKKYTDKNGTTQYTGEFDKTEEIYKTAESFIRIPEKEEYHRNGWWVDWFYVPTGGTEIMDSQPNFKECNDAYYDLYEKDEYREFVDSAVQGVKLMKRRCS